MSQKSPLKGCLIVFGILFLLAILAFVFLFRFTRNLTETSPRQFPAPKAERNQAASEKIGELYMGVQNGVATRIELTADDLNDLLSANDPDNKIKSHVIMEKGQLLVEVSAPVEHVVGFSGRYFNATVGVNITVTDGILNLSVRDAQTKTKSIPTALIKKANQTIQSKLDLALRGIPRVKEFLTKIKDVHVEDSKLVIQTLAEPIPINAASPNSETATSTLPSDSAD